MRTAPLCKALAVGLAALLLLPAARAGDWYSWRGPENNGVSREKNLPESFDPEKPGQNNLVWKAPYGCRTTPIVHKGRVFLINSAGEGLREQERVMALDEKTGKVLWEYKFNVFHTDIVSARLGWTNPCVDPETGYVYAHGTQGLLLCLHPETGKLLWSRSLTEEFGRISGYGGRVTSPIIDEDKLIIGMLNASWGKYARGGNRYVAFDKKTGDIIWWGSTGLQVKDTYYSQPVVAVIKGQRLLLSGGGEGAITAFKVRTGEKVWSYVFGAGAVNCSPVVQGDRIWIAHGDENPDSTQQGRIICLDASQIVDGKPKLVWKVDGPRIKFSSPILHEGRLYVADMVARLDCYDAETGKRLWFFKFGKAIRGSPVLADGKIYVGDVDGHFHILKPGDKRCQSLHKQAFASRVAGQEVELNGSPAVANGRVFFATNEELYCIGNSGTPAEPDKIPEPVKEPGEKGKAAWLQVVPADVTLHAGDSQTFKARLFDANGRFIKEVKAQWELGPMQAPEKVSGLPDIPMQPPKLQGTISADGKLTLAGNLKGQAGEVLALAEGLTGRAFVRQAPKLPYAEDFEKIPEGRTPGGWVNTQGKFAVRKVGNSNVLVKLATNPSPLVARANAYITIPATRDYTIEADVMGAKKGNDLPDVGVVNSRYSLVLIGATQTLRLISWDAIPRVDRSIAYPWKENTWYRLKLTASVENGKGIIKGKVWPVGEQEPEKWTVEFEDPIPNPEGSAGLYGNATGIIDGQVGAEGFFDNVKITPNKK